MAEYVCLCMYECVCLCIMCVCLCISVCVYAYTCVCVCVCRKQDGGNGLKVTESNINHTNRANKLMLYDNNTNKSLKHMNSKL